MGGNISSMARASTALDSYVAELGNDISYEKSLSSSRFMKTILARHANGPLVLKIFIKPDASVELYKIKKRLEKERDALDDLPGVNTYQTFVETEKAGYLIRQWIGSNLYDRVSTQPYLANIEKKWIAFQLLTALRDARTLGVSHGDIKSENVLITSDLSVLLTDFSSSFKPLALPLDDPSDFSFFFDTSARRTCYIAPERFYASAQEKSKIQALRHPTEEMDVFGLGCVLAEMWTDGRTVFNLSELFAYRNGSLSLDGVLDNIDDPHVAMMIRHMLSLDPAERPTFDRILAEFRETVFPEYFYTFLREYTVSLAELPASSPKSPATEFLQRSAVQAGTRIDRMLNEWESISVYLEDQKGDENGPGLLLLNLVTSSIRNCVWPASRLHGLQLFLRLCPYIVDEDKIDRIIPFVVELSSDDVALVRAEACDVLVTVVSTLTSASPSNATFIPEYLLPQMRHLASDPDVFVRATYAKGLVRIADAAVTMLEMSQNARIPRAELEASGVIEPDYDSMLLEIQTVIEEQATALLVDPSSHVKRAMLANISDLCLFFGRQKSNETVLSHIMTYLNDRDWHLRLAFFDGIVGVGAFIGIRAVEEYVLPLMIQALSDPEEAVIARVISSLTSLASLGLLARMRMWDVFFHIKGFLCHPNAWLRQGTAGFIAAAARNLSPSDTWCILYPAIRTMLHTDIKELNEDSLMAAVLPPFSRATLGAARIAALAKSPPTFWDKVQQGGNMKAFLTKAALSANGGDTNGTQLRDKGIWAKDERKIAALRDFIFKQAHAARAREASDQAVTPETALVDGKSVSLKELGVTPQTIFISPRTVGADATSMPKLRLKPHLPHGMSSRRTSMASRSARGTVDNPLEEVRRKLAALEPHARPGERPAVVAAGTSSNKATEASTVTDSPLSSSIDLTSVTRQTGRKRVESGKAAPAVAAVHTNALGTTSIHDDLPSGLSTPTAVGAGSASTPRPQSSGALYGSSYEGQDPGVRAFLEQVDLDTYREPLLDLGPRIVASQRRRIPRGNKASTVQGSTMIGHMTDHTRAVTAIVTSPDHVFFATASEDRQILIWDSARLERSVSSRARKSYPMKAPVSAMCRLENTHCLAAASEDGQVHVLRVHVSTGNAGGGSSSSSSGTIKYGAVECIGAWEAPKRDGYVRFISHLPDTSRLLLVTSTSVIAILDIRSMTIVKRYQHPLERGVITAICSTASFAVVATELGILSLWDLRFGLLVKSWRASGPVTSAQLHPARGKSLWVILAIRRHDINAPVMEVHDIETSRIVEVFEIRQTKLSSKVPPAASGSASPNALDNSIPDKQALIAKLATPETVEGEGDMEEGDPVTHIAPPPSVLAMAVGQSLQATSARDADSGSLLLSVPEGGALRTPVSPGFLVSAGEDRVVRFWDLVRPAGGLVVCGSAKEKNVVFRQSVSAVPNVLYTVPPTAARTADRDLSAAHGSSRTTMDKTAVLQMQRQPLRPHYDAICALGTIETSSSSCVISADRSGVIKVWRVEGGPSAG